MNNKSFYYVLIGLIVIIIAFVTCEMFVFTDHANNEPENTNIYTNPVTESIIESETIALPNISSINTESATDVAYTEPETEMPETEHVTEQVTELETGPKTEPLDPHTLTLGQIENELYYHDIPLTYEQQDVAMRIAGEYNLPVDLLYAIMHVETHFTIDIISSTNDYGIMQINKNNHEWLNQKIGAENFLDYDTNVRCGAYVLRANLKMLKDNTVSKLLMCYNRGYGGAQKAWKKGETFDYYCEKVMEELLNLQAARHTN